MKRATYRAGALMFGLVCSASVALAADYTMKVSLSASPRPDHYLYTPLEEFEKEIEAQSKGAIDVEIYWSGALGKNESVVNLVRQGQVEVLMTSEGHVVPYYPDLQVLGIPYLFLNREIAYSVFDGEFGQNFAEKIANESGIRPINWMENGGYRHFTSNVPMKTADDLKGQKIRTMTNPVHMAIVEALGASPTPIAWSDLYTALQTGVVDGEENSIPTFRIPKLEEVQKHIILDGHVYSVSALWASEKWLDTLPDDLRDVVMTAAKNMQKANRALSVKNETRDRKYLEDYGVTIVDLPNEEKERFRELTQGPALKVLKEEISQDIIDEMLSAVAKAESES